MVHYGRLGVDDLKIFDDLDGVDPGDDLVYREHAAAVPSRSATSAAVSNAVVAAVAVGAGIGVVTAPGAPTGWRPADLVLGFAFGALVTVATAKARRWSWFVLAALAALGAEGRDLLVVAFAVVAICLASVALPRANARYAGALVGALSVQVLVRMPERGTLGLTALWSALALIPVFVSAYRRSRSRSRRVIRLSVLAVGGLAVLACLAFAVVALMARSAMLEGANLARSGFDSARAGRQDEAVEAFRGADRSFTEASDLLGAAWARPVRLVPIAGPQAFAAEAMAVSGKDLARTAAAAAGTVHYDELRTRNGMIDLGMLSSMRQPVRNAQDALDRARARLSAADNEWLLPALSTPLAELRGEVDRARSDTDLAAEAIDVAPSLLGADRPKRYLILFANTAESRFLGGYVASYGELLADNGKLSLTRSGRISELSEAPGADARTLSGPPEFIERFGRLFPQRYLQNLTASPDFEVDASVARELYPKAGGSPIDGVVYVDPFGLAALLRLTGPVSIEGSAQQLTADNAAMYLLRDQYLAVAEAGERYDLLAKASQATFQALTSRELPGPRAVGDALGPAVREGRLHAVTFDEAGRSLLDRLGAVRTFPGGGDGTRDFLSVRSSNNNPNKIDSFLRRDITYEAVVDQRSGEVTATASVVLQNDAPGALLPPYIIGNEQRAGQETAPPGTNTMFLSVYSNLDLDGATYDGAAVPVAAQHESGHQVYSVLVRVPPKSEGTLVLRLRGRLGGAVAAGRYHLDLAPQPMVNPDRVTVSVTPGPDQVLSEAQGLTPGRDGARGEYSGAQLRSLAAVVGPP